MRLYVPGPPQPWRRTRLNVRGGRVVAFHDRQSDTYADLIRWAWREAGSPTFGDQPVALTVTCMFPRPASHFTRKGALSAAGRRAVLPSRADVDNLAKAVMDALNGLAWADDRQIVDLNVTKEWAALNPNGCVLVDAQAVTAPGVAA